MSVIHASLDALMNLSATFKLKPSTRLHDGDADFYLGPLARWPGLTVTTHRIKMEVRRLVTLVKLIATDLCFSTVPILRHGQMDYHTDTYNATDSPSLLRTDGPAKTTVTWRTDRMCPPHC
eukprot:455417-Amphidinium_carterae.1